MKVLRVTAGICAAIVLSSTWVSAQTCIVGAPGIPPTPTRLVVELPADGGAVGCFVYAVVPSAVKAPTAYPIGNAKCAQAVAMAQQAAANDNGWNDGGSP